MSSFLPDPATTAEISPSAVAAWINLPPDQRPRLIDCREADELAICKLPGIEWIPLGAFPERWQALISNPNLGVVIYCHHGMRSLHAAMFLRSKGCANAFSMSGGIDLWSTSVDPDIPRY
ncbi:rhodanese [Luteolibacter pohnpeiensis]|uniref:Rhodanese n=1 Tax=Luteolibacter pohnpeiensis TaxID=454153 RepID=A0A934S764_9BACT|nr:rhodanese-like domain-containing protein [Luteolibacter pohnpeiensis]MBK1883472.1 rhodanese [Luteolibacter pohnpeiensis]